MNTERDIVDILCIHPWCYQYGVQYGGDGRCWLSKEDPIQNAIINPDDCASAGLLEVTHLVTKRIPHRGTLYVTRPTFKDGQIVLAKRSPGNTYPFQVYRYSHQDPISRTHYIYSRGQDYLKRMPESIQSRIQNKWVITAYEIQELDEDLIGTAG
jgi:hypothetical protein